MDVPENDYRNSLQIGTVLYFNGYGDDSYVIIKNLGISEYYGANYVGINLRMGKELRFQAFSLKPLSEKKDNSIQVYITNEVKNADEIMDAINAREAEKVRAAKEAEEKETARARYVEKIKKDYSFLKTVEESGKSSAATGAANLKKELQRAFPGRKVRATSEYYSMGCSIRARVSGLEWKSKELEQAQEIGRKYAEGKFDGMTDYYDYVDNPFSDMYGGAKYVFVDGE